jgi:hypothetical protein
MIAASAMAAVIPTIPPSSGERPRVWSSSPATYAATAMKTEWPSEMLPVRPQSRFQLCAQSAKKAMLVATLTR